MKIKKDYVIRELDDGAVVVAVGKESKKFQGMISLNESGTFIWKLIAKKEMTESEILQKVSESYNVDLEEAKKDLTEFLDRVREAELLDE